MAINLIEAAKNKVLQLAQNLGNTAKQAYDFSFNSPNTGFGRIGNEIKNNPAQFNVLSRQNVQQNIPKAQYLSTVQTGVKPIDFGLNFGGNMAGNTIKTFGSGQNQFGEGITSFKQGRPLEGVTKLAFGGAKMTAIPLNPLFNTASAISAVPNKWGTPGLISPDPNVNTNNDEVRRLATGFMQGMTDEKTLGSNVPDKNISLVGQEFDPYKFVGSMAGFTSNPVWKGIFPLTSKLEGMKIVSSPVMNFIATRGIKGGIEGLLQGYSDIPVNSTPQERFNYLAQQGLFGAGSEVAMGAGGKLIAKGMDTQAGREFTKIMDSATGKIEGAWKRAWIPVEGNINLKTGVRDVKPLWMEQMDKWVEKYNPGQSVKSTERGSLEQATLNAEQAKLSPQGVEAIPEGKARLRTPLVEPRINAKGKVEMVEVKGTDQLAKREEIVPEQVTQTLGEAKQGLPTPPSIEEQLPVSSAKILPEKGKLNVEKLNLNQSQKQAIRDLQANIPTTVIGHKEIVDKAALAKPRTRPLNDAEQADIIARQLASRQQVTSLTNEFTKLQQSGASDLELKSQLSQIADASRVAQQTGTFAGRLLEAQKIVANDLATPMQRIFALLDSAGVDKSKYLDDAVKIDFNNPNQVVEFYRKYVPPKLSEVLTEIRYTNMLSSPNTQINNAASNFLMTGVVRPVTKTLAGGIDWAKNSLTGSERKYYASQGLDYAKGYWKSLPEAWGKFKTTLGNSGIESKPDMERMPVFTKGIGKLYTTPLRMLEASDQFFRTLTTKGELAAGMSIKDAEKSAQYQLFRQKFDPTGELGSNKILQTFDKWNSFIQGARRLPGGNWILPFMQTPTNILKQGLEYSPLGVITAPGAKEPVEQLAKAAVGSTVFMAAYGLANSGVTTWGAPTNQKEKDLFYAAGMQPYSVKIGDKWVSYSKLGPLSYPIAMAASLKDAADRNPDMNTIEQLQQGAVGTLGFFADQSYVRSIGDLVTSIQQGKSLSVDSLKAQMANFAGQLVPYSAFMGWLTRLTDPGTKRPEFGNISQKIQASIPGLSKNIPTYEGAPSQAIANINAFSPLRISQENSNVDLYNAQKQNVIQSGVENRIKKQLESQGSGSTVTGQSVQYVDNSGNVKKIDYGKVASLPSNTTYEAAIKSKKAYALIDDVVNADIPEDQKQTIYEGLGITPQKAKYYTVAKEDNDIKTAYIMDKLGTLEAKDRKGMMDILVQGRLEVNKQSIVSDGVLTNLYNEGLIDKTELKQLKALKIDSTGKKPVAKMTGRGRTAKLKKIKFTPLKFKFKATKKIKDYNLSSLKLKSFK